MTTGHVFERVVRRTCDAFAISREDLLGSSKRLAFAHPRQVVYYVLAERYGWGPVEIGHRTGRDHSTVVHALGRVRERMRVDNRLASAVEWIGSPEPAAVLDARRRIDAEHEFAVAVDALIARAAAALTAVAKANAETRRVTAEAADALSAREAALDSREAQFARGLSPYLTRASA